MQLTIGAIHSLHSRIPILKFAQRERGNSGALVEDICGRCVPENRRIFCPVEHVLEDTGGEPPPPCDLQSAFKKRCCRYAEPFASCSNLSMQFWISGRQIPGAEATNGAGNLAQ